MRPEIGQRVKCVLNNGTVIEGIVKNWGNEVELLSLDEQSILIIPRPTTDIMLIKIMLKSKKKETVSNLEEEFDKVYEQPSNDDLRLNKMVELKTLLADQERAIIKNKLHNHQIGNIRKVEYGFPGLGKK